MDNQAVYRHQPLWGSWKIEELIGNGSYGSVYKVSKDLFGIKTYSAVKYIPVPGKEQMDNIISAVGSNEQAKTACIKNSVNAIVNEIQLLIEMRGLSNILSYEDHLLIENPDNTWDIFVRMEYSTPLNRYMQENSLTIFQ